MNTVLSKGLVRVNCVYVNPEIGQFWVIDYRIYDPEGDGKSKLDHVEDMLQGIVYHKLLPFDTVLMDSWYATNNLMQYIEALGKYYYCPLKRNRLVDDTEGREKYKPIEALEWSECQQEKGKIIKIKAFPKNKRVKLFRVIVSTDKTEFIVTNDFTQDSTDVVQEVCDVCLRHANANDGRLRSFKRVLKQLTGVESCQCRKARIQRNHIGACMLVWLKLKDMAYQTGQTIYQLKYGLLSNYLIQQLKRPAIAMSLV